MKQEILTLAVITQPLVTTFTASVVRAPACTTAPYLTAITWNCENTTALYLTAITWNCENTTALYLTAITWNCENTTSKPATYNLENCQDWQRVFTNGSKLLHKCPKICQHNLFGSLGMQVFHYL